MIRFSVPDMTCASCVAAVTKAVQRVAPGATLRADLATHVVEIDGGESGALAAAITDAGFTPAVATP